MDWKYVLLWFVCLFRWQGHLKHKACLLHRCFSMCLQLQFKGQQSWFQCLCCNYVDYIGKTWTNTFTFTNWLQKLIHVYEIRWAFRKFINNIYLLIMIVYTFMHISHIIHWLLACWEKYDHKIYVITAQIQSNKKFKISDTASLY